MLHGNMCSSEHCSSLLEKIDPELYTFYALDLRGFGDSTYFSPINSVEDFSNDVYKFINHMDLDKVSLIGWSAGGPICLQFCIDYPKFVKEIILLSSVGLKGAPLQRKDNEGKVSGGYYKTKEEMVRGPEVAVPLKAIQNKDFNTLSDMWNRGIYTNKKPSESKNEKLIRETLKQQNLGDVYWALANFNLSNEYNGYREGNGLIEQVKVPVLCFWGEQDRIINFNDVNETVKSLPNASLRVLKECGHFPIIDNLDAIIRGIGETFT
ncbi:alpha/beta hydrolase [Bacillus sp. J14TS2]|nr:alpha/beta hydrolase [Bacillus sp. J14TS2]